MNIEAEVEQIRQHIEKDNFHAAMNLAISAMNECRRNDDQAGVDYFIKMIRSIANAIAEVYGDV